MRVGYLLLAHSVKRVRTLVLITGLLLCGFQIVLILAAGSIHKNGGFEQISALIPPFAREMMGPALASFMSFAGIVSLGYFHLAVLSALVAIAISLATVPTAEVESGFVDLILARPVARYWLITRTIVLVILATVFVLSLMMTGTWIGLQTMAPRTIRWPSAKLILSLAANLSLLMLAWSGVAMAIGSRARRRAVAGALGGLLALSAFLLDYVGRLWRTAETVAWLSPFRYFSPFELVMGTPLPVKNLLVLGGIAAAGFALAYYLYARRDISH